MADEVEHTQLCFSVAARYGGTKIGPGLLSEQGCLDQSDPLEIFAIAFQEACVGETVAALEATEAAQRAQDPELRALLSRIGEDEGRHAELGWRFVSWMLETTDSGLRAKLLHAFSSLLRDALNAGCFNPEPESLETRMLEQHGMLGPNARAALRASTLQEVIAPCAAALLRRYEQGPARQLSETCAQQPGDS